MRSNLFVCILALGLLSVSFAVAAPSAPLELDVGTSTSRDLSTIPAQSAQAQGGNVTEINIAALTITKTWQGYYGNVSGQIALQDGRNNTFYNWSVASASGEVYATRASAVTWTGVACASAGERTAEETFLNHTATDDDSVSNTFGLTAHPEFIVAGTTIAQNSCYSTYGYVNNASQSTDFVMLLLQSGTDIIYTSILDDDTVGFDGQEHDFELLVGENERNNTAVTPYYFWVELS